MNECRLVRKRLGDYVVGGLAPRRRRWVEAHVAGCARCRAELRALEQTGALLEALGPEAAPDDWEAIRARLVFPRPVAPRPLRLAWGAAMLVVGLAMLVWGGLVHRPPGERGSGVSSPTRQQLVADELRPVVEHHLAATWAGPLADEAATGLRLAALEEGDG